jgi:hypothetical protein
VAVLALVACGRARELATALVPQVARAHEQRAGARRADARHGCAAGPRRAVPPLRRTAPGRSRRQGEPLFERHGGAQARKPIRGLGLRILLQPSLAFLKLYIGKRYFLNGWAGYFAARTHAFYTFLKYAKVLEAQRNRDQSP